MVRRKMPHDHCDKCYKVHCQVSCLIIKCPKNCGASFHSCKEEEHQLLCPNQTVPCLNVLSGCPLTMLRHRLAKHLEVCPASVVCCSQEWNRWPVSDADLTFCRNVSESPEGGRSLDVAMALRDQELLFRSIKMKNIFPELMERDVSAEVSSPADEATCGVEKDCRRMEEEELSQEERDALATSRDVDGIQKYSSWERMFNKEKEGCKETVRNLNKKEGRGSQPSQESAAAAPSGGGATGLAPWQDGVLQRLSQEVNIAEYNMYLVHNGSMLINFGQLAACTPREKDFVYGSLEPIEVKTVRSFNVPTSYRAKRNYLKDQKAKASVSVDTADLGVSVENLPKFDEVSATLLQSLEKELRGHLISESVGRDGLYVDVGTQTYDFASAPFKPDASLADVIADKPHALHVHVDSESVTRRHNKTSSAFSYTCGHFFRRDEYRSHFRNVHCDIQASLSGWFQQRCPLAYLGCAFTQTRFHPAGHQAAVKYCRDVSALVLQPEVASRPCEGGELAAHGVDPLSSLPLEILQHVAAYLDSFTLSQLSQVSRLMREVCSTLLLERGMVSLRWKKKTYSHGGSAWRCREKVWEFSSLFSSVDRWSFSDAPSMSDHLRSCSFYQREERSEPVALACLGEVRDKHREGKQER